MPPKTPLKVPATAAAAEAVKELPPVIHQPPVFASSSSDVVAMEVAPKAAPETKVPEPAAPVSKSTLKPKLQKKPRKRAADLKAVEQALTWAAVARLHRRAPIPVDGIRRVRRIHAALTEAKREQKQEEEEEPLVMKMSAIADPEADGKNMQQVACEKLMEFLVPRVRAAILVNQHREGKTVMNVDVKYALSLMGTKMYGDSEGLAFNSTEKARKHFDATDEYVPDPDDVKAMELEDKRDYYSEAEGDCDL